ncbi:hypothetical protein [Sphingopyxis sp. A083]|uniref:hypothetical protein n=1 Tax=Sphingopyxis sp. A083 TaxID=1759083 RepID=UPI000736010C|nr:hypothetical protein [Sphingopyxis sp. A083]
MMQPLPMPELPAGVARVEFEPERVDYAAPESSGRQGGVQAGWPLWLATFELDKVDRDSADLWRAFIARLRGRQRLFLASDPTRLYPRSTPRGFAGMTRAGGGAFTGSATSWAQNVDADGNAAIGLTGLPANLALATGDYIGWKWDAAGSAAGSYDRRTMARVVVPAVASAGGGITVTVEPPLDPLVVPVGAIAHLDKPACLMRQIPDRSRIGSTGAGGALSGATLVAGQDLRP